MRCFDQAMVYRKWPRGSPGMAPNAGFPSGLKASWPWPCACAMLNTPGPTGTITSSHAGPP